MHNILFVLGNKDMNNNLMKAIAISIGYVWAQDKKTKQKQKRNV